MRDVAIGAVGALVLVACAGALIEFHHRAGPHDVALEPVHVVADAGGHYHAAGPPVLPGVCVLPCGPRTTVDLTLAGLPDVPLDARLVGDDAVDLGPLRRVGDEHRLSWQEDEDHTDKTRLEFTMAGRVVAWLPVGAGALIDLHGPVDVAWPTPATPAHLNEIGGFFVSTIAKAHLAEPPPTGWEFRAYLTGAKTVDLGTLRGAVLDARVEHVPLERHDALLVTLCPRGGEGLPVLRATW